MAEFDDEDEDLGLGDDEDKRRKPLEAAADAKLNPSIGTPIVAPPGQQAGPAAALATPKSIGTPITQEAPPDLGTGLTVPQSIGGVIAPESQPALPNRPTSADAAYQPNELHGWRKALGIASAGAAGGANPALGQEVVHNLFDQPKIDAQNKLKADQGAYDTEFNQGQKVLTDKAANDEREALANKANTPPVTKPTYESIAAMHAAAVNKAIQEKRDPSTDPEVLQIEDAMQRVQKEPTPKTPSEFEQFYGDFIKDKELPDNSHSRILARQEYAKAGKVEPPNEGTWTLEEDADGKPVLFNAKTGQTKPAPAGMQKTGTKSKADAAQEKLIGPARDAQQYADDYLTNGRFTGSGDEALQEKFFELAKPTTGFRMTDPQIKMLQNSRSWMDSAEAKLRHATTGTWFSEDQRKQIVQTMKDLAAAKMKGQSGGAGAAHGGSAPAGGKDPLGIL